MSTEQQPQSKFPPLLPRYSIFWSLVEELHPQMHPGDGCRVRQQSSSGVPAPPLLTLRNLWSRKANQFVSIFSATDSVLGKAEGTHHTQSRAPAPQPGAAGRGQRPPRCQPVTALLGLVTASPVTLSSPHAVQITAWLSKSLRFTAVPGNQGQPSDNGREIAAFSPVPPSVLSPHCARDYL